MNTEVQKLYDKVKKLNKKILEIQSNCPHENVKTQFDSNTGNYDPTSDSYWVNVKCLDCGAFNYYDSVEDAEMYRKYPYDYATNKANLISF